MQDTDQTMRASGLTIAHTTDLQDHEHGAFAHAVALALRSKSRLVSIHVNDDESVRARMPQAVELLARWGHLPGAGTPGAEHKLGMQHESLLDACCDDPVDTLVRVINDLQPQLVVGATSGREGLARTVIGSVSEALALHSGVPTLLVPTGCRPFVSDEDGAVSLQRILVAAGDAYAAQVGATHAVWLVDLLGASQVEIEILHVEDSAPVPAPSVPQREGIRLRVATLPGGIEATLLERARSWQADAVVMATRGHDSLRDILLGSHAERVIRRAPCPVLSVPLHGTLISPAR